VEYAGNLAVIIRERGDALLIRYASRRGGYHWVGRTAVRRRADMDGVALDPPWLTQARRSTRPPLVLYALLHGLSTIDDVPPEPVPPVHDFETDADGRPLDGGVHD